MQHSEDVGTRSDYDVFFIANKQEAKEQVDLAKNLLDEIEKYCTRRW